MESSYDAWKLLAAQAYGIDYAEVTQEQRDTIKRDCYSGRPLAKNINFKCSKYVGNRHIAQTINFVRYYGNTECFISSDDSLSLPLLAGTSN